MEYQAMEALNPAERKKTPKAIYRRGASRATSR